MTTFFERYTAAIARSALIALACALALLIYFVLEVRSELIGSRDSLNDRVDSSLSKVAAACTRDIDAPTRTILNRTAKALEQLPSCGDALRTLQSIQEGLQPSREALDLLKAGRIKEIGDAVLGGDGIADRAKRIDEAASATRQSTVAIDDQLSRLLACDPKSPLADKTLCGKDGRLPSGVTSRVLEGQATLLSRLGDLDRRDQERWPEVRKGIETTVNRAAEAVQTPERAVVSWLAGQKWNGQPQVLSKANELSFELPVQTDELLKQCHRIDVTAVFAVDPKANLRVLDFCGSDLQGKTSSVSCALSARGVAGQTLDTVVVALNGLAEQRRADSRRACVGSVKFGPGADAKALLAVKSRSPIRLQLTLPP